MPTSYAASGSSCKSTLTPAAMEIVANLRFLARRKTIAIVAVLTMACALGVNAAALAVVRAFLFSSLGVPEPDRLMSIAPERVIDGRGTVIFFDAYPNYLTLRETRRAFAEMAATVQNVVSWKNGTDVRALQATRASATFFATMGVNPMLGRPFTEEEEGPSPDPVVVLSHSLWSGAMGGDPSVVGRSMTIDGRPVTVIGVMPEGFAQPAPTDVWMPFDLPPNVRAAITGGRIVAIHGRLANGVSRQAADREADEFTRRTLEASPDNRDFTYRAQSLREQLLNDADNTVLLVQGAAAVLLVLASLNLMSLLVAWGFERRQEMAIRLALGGGGGRVLRLLVTQALLIVTAGMAVGIAFARVLLVGVRQLDLGPQLGFFLQQARLDGVLLLACVPLAVLLAIVAGVVPAALNRRIALAQALRSSSRSVSQSAAALRLQRLMVVAQAAFSVVVLASAAVLGISFRNLSSVPDGFEASGRVVARITLPDDRYRPHARRVTFANTLMANMSREPGLASYAFTSTLPVGDLRRGGRFYIPDESGATEGEPLLLHFRRVSPEYLQVMGMPLLRGRHFTAADDSASPNVAIVSRATADKYWPGREAIGQRMLRVVAGGAPQPTEVVGVVEDAMDGGYEATRGEAVYMPYAQTSLTAITIVAQSARPAEGIAAIRRALAATDPLIAPTGAMPLERLVANANVLPQLRALMLLVFAVASVAIAGLGSYGVMRQLVANREREFALRLVFGAVPRDLGREVLMQVARLAVPGIAVGLLGAWFAASLLRAFLFAVDPRSIIVLGTVAFGVLLLAIITAMPTVVRAMRIDVRSGTAT